jgi:hypothetical protein
VDVRSVADEGCRLRAVVVPAAAALVLPPAVDEIDHVSLVFGARICLDPYRSDRDFDLIVDDDGPRRLHLRSATGTEKDG